MNIFYIRARGVQKFVNAHQLGMVSGEVNLMCSWNSKEHRAVMAWLLALNSESAPKFRLIVDLMAAVIDSEQNFKASNKRVNTRYRVHYSLKVANHHQMAPVTSVPEPYNQDWSSRRAVIGHKWFLNDQLWQSDDAVCLLYGQWQQCLKILDFNCRLGCKKICCLFFFLCRMIGPQNGGGVKFVNIAENFDGQAILKLLLKCCPKMVLRK